MYHLPFPLNAAVDADHAGAEHDAPVFLKYLYPDDEIGDAGFVLQRDEHGALGGARPLDRNEGKAVLSVSAVEVCSRSISWNVAGDLRAAKCRRLFALISNSTNRRSCNFTAQHPKERGCAFQRVVASYPAGARGNVPAGHTRGPTGLIEIARVRRRCMCLRTRCNLLAATVAAWAVDNRWPLGPGSGIHDIVALAHRIGRLTNDFRNLQELFGQGTCLAPDHANCSRGLNTLKASDRH
jgi:hypothetical protein